MLVYRLPTNPDTEGNPNTKSETSVYNYLGPNVSPRKDDGPTRICLRKLRIRSQRRRLFPHYYYQKVNSYQRSKFTPLCLLRGSMCVLRELLNIDNKKRVLHRFADFLPYRSPDLPNTRSRLEVFQLTCWTSQDALRY